MWPINYYSISVEHFNLLLSFFFFSRLHVAFLWVSFFSLPSATRSFSFVLSALFASSHQQYERVRVFQLCLVTAEFCNCVEDARHFSAGLIIVSLCLVHSLQPTAQFALNSVPMRHTVHLRICVHHSDDMFCSVLYCWKELTSFFAPHFSY